MKDSTKTTLQAIAIIILGLFIYFYHTDTLHISFIAIYMGIIGIFVKSFFKSEEGKEDEEKKDDFPF